MVALSAVVANRSDDVGSDQPAEAASISALTTVPATDNPTTTVPATGSSPTTSQTPSTVAAPDLPGIGNPTTTIPATTLPATTLQVPTTVLAPLVPSTGRPAATPQTPPTVAPRTVPASTGTVAPSPPVSGGSASLLNALTVEAEPPRVGYERSLFPHWRDVNGTGCTAREDALFASVIGFPQVDLFDRCVIVEGDWLSIYDGVLHEGAPGDVDVDHVVALAEAWDSGARNWDESTRRRFANDADNLLVVSASSNRSKSDRDVGEWRPQRRDSWCQTAQITVTIKHRYRLSVDAAELGGLRDMLATCTTSALGPAPGPAPGITVAPIVVVPTTVVAAPAPSGPCVDINTATVEQLDAIVHIGPARAADIVRLRPFSSVNDLVRVSGIGEARLRDIVAQGLVCS